jgi:hypothetical protein
VTDPTKTPETVKILREDGPQPPSTLSLWPELRDSGSVRTFQPEPAKHTTGVAYLPDEHDPEVIVATYLEINGWTDANEATTPTAWKIHNRIADDYPEFKAAATELLGPFAHHDNRDTNPDRGGTCPICGEDYQNTLPEHLPCG